MLQAGGIYTTSVRWVAGMLLALVLLSVGISIAVMRRLALEAGDRIMAIYNGPDFEVKAKGDLSPVTEADEAADALISAGLMVAFPGVVLITEEQAATGEPTVRPTGETKGDT